MQDPGKHQERSRYATSAGFRKIFAAEIDGLYQLAFVLTVDPEKAEQAFVAGLEDSLKSNHIFNQWAHSWAKRMVIQNAIRLVQPRPTDANFHAALAFPDEQSRETSKNSFDLRSIQSLAPFERFVFVMTVLEHHSDLECALLLNCIAFEVRQARANALEQLAESDQAAKSSAVNPDQPDKSPDLVAGNKEVAR